MSSFLLAFIAGFGIICSLAGWGALVVRALRIRFSAGIGFCAAVGLAFSTGLGAYLNLFHWVRPAILQAYLLAGLAIAAVMGLLKARGVRDRVASWLASLRRTKVTAFLAGVLVMLTFVKYSTAVSPGEFHLQDDYHAYFAFPVAMLQTGSLVREPFSERSIVSSLGGESFLDTLMLSATGSVRNLRLVDEGVSYIILLLLLAEIMLRKRIAKQWTILALIAASFFPAPLSNITSVYGGIALLILLFDLLDRTVTLPDLNLTILLAIVLASLSSLKSTFAPMGGVFFLSFFTVQILRLPSRGKTLARAGFCVFLIVALLLPWMLHAYSSSGTLLYPLFGKGFHGSRYGVYLLPTANMGLHNLLAFFDGFANAVGVILTIQTCLILMARRQGISYGLTAKIVAINLWIDVVFIGVATGGVQMYRYSFAILFACMLFLLIEQLALLGDTAKSIAGLASAQGIAAVLSIGMLFGEATNASAADQKDRLASLKFGLTGQRIASPSMRSDYRNLQLAIPPGQAVMVRMDKNFLFDFRRNPIYINDLPGGASLPPGIPIFQGPEALASYLVNHGIRYLAYSYGDEATFSRAKFNDRLQPGVNVWLRKGAEIAFDFQDNALALGRTRKKLYDNGNMFVLDLQTRVPPNAASSVQ